MIDTAEDKGCDLLRWPMVYKAISNLTEQEQTFITLRYFQDLNYEQIAQLRGLKAGSVRVTLHRAIKKLKALLTPHTKGGSGNDK